MTNHSRDIDLVARAITGTEPPTDLEARIKHRLDTETLRTPSRWKPAYWIGAAGLTAAAALLALVVQGPTMSTVQGSPEVPVSLGPEVRGEVTGARGFAVPQLTRLGPDAGPRGVEPSGPGNSAVNRGTLGPRDLRTSVRPSETELAWMARRVPALEMIDPLAMDRLTVHSIQPDTLSISPLTITPLVTSPVHGDPDTGRQR